VVVGSANRANWPTTDPIFAQESERTTWRETPVPSGAVPQWIVDEANEDLQGLVDILGQADVEVIRPTDMDFIALDGMYNYCPRDRLLIAGTTIVDPAMMYPCRDQEAHAYEFLLSHDHRCLTMPRDQDLILDAANVCRLNDTWLFLESNSGNRAAATWLQAQFPEINIEICNFYAGVHIDSTITPLREGLVALNASRVTPENCPQALRDWDKIWVHDVVAQDFYQYPYASRWIAMNMLSIDPDTVIVDGAQTQLITTLERRGITVIPHSLRHSRTLGGGFHCVTLDLWRQHA
jgi:glycine amidinotransferase/scyllo-inosamine-4-phosphate amidinotransferase 1